MSAEVRDVSRVAGWYSLALGDGVDALAPTHKIQDAYMAWALTTKLPGDCAVFSFYDLRANVVTTYFSPSAAPLAVAFGAKPCASPENREGFGMLVGSADAWELLFRT